MLLMSMYVSTWHFLPLFFWFFIEHLTQRGNKKNVNATTTDIHNYVLSQANHNYFIHKYIYTNTHLAEGRSSSRKWHGILHQNMLL